MKKSVFIIDGLRDRQEAMAEAFQDIPGLRLFALQTGKLYAYNTELSFWAPADPPEEPVDLLLIHGRDCRQGDYLKSKRRIWYGGYAGNDPKAPPGEDSITRPIEHASEALNQEEALRLLAYAEGGEQPACLKPEGYDDNLNNIIELSKVLMNTEIANRRKLLKEKLKRLKSRLQGELMDRIGKEVEYVVENNSLPRKERIHKISKIRDHLLRAANVI